VPHIRAACLAVITIGRGRGHSPLKALLAPLFATFGAILGAVGGDVRRCLPVIASRSPHLIDGGALGGDAARLIERVPNEVAMSALPRALCTALRQHARTTLASPAVCQELIAPFLLP
jgi:hypothetical protein